MMKAILLGMFVMYVLSGNFKVVKKKTKRPLASMKLVNVLSYETTVATNNTDGFPSLVTGPASGYMIVVGPLGGNSGASFTDENYWKKYGKKITAVRIHHGQIIDGIQFKYGDQWGPLHGGNGGALSTLDFTTQKISLVQGSYGHASTYYQPQPLVTSLSMIIDDGTVFGPFGMVWGPSYSPNTFISNPKPCHLAYVSGREGTVSTGQIRLYLVSLTLHWQC
eukprot:GFUD01012016.1.p1 GENE.GFUD01012016.1~~GFUD01012016.1.p1  ORF type:complete len:246 (+),score=16.32 GFUD01012016.1:74-739(+)